MDARTLAHAGARFAVDAHANLDHVPHQPAEAHQGYVNAYNPCDWFKQK